MSSIFDYEAIARGMGAITGDVAEEVCPQCEGCGWMYSSYQAAHAPNFIECDMCYNPEDLPNPC